MRWWRASSLLAVSSMALVYLAGVTQLGEAEAEPALPVPAVASDPGAEIADFRADAPVGADDPEALLTAALDDADLALDLVEARPDPDAGELSAALAAFAEDAGEFDPVEVGEFFTGLGEEHTAWLSVLYPSVIGDLPGAPFEARATANRLVIEAAGEASTRFDGPERPWTAGAERPPREEIAELAGGDREFLYFDPYNNSGDGSWIEVVGDLATAETVTVLVPGGSAVLTSANFDIYYQRAKSFSEASDGRLAVVVWAGASWPSGWIEESWASWAAVAAAGLSSFTADLRAQVGEDVPITLAGHSYGGAVIGLAETDELAADRILHIASAGMGNDVYEPADLAEPCRPRYSMTAPGDPIEWIQGAPYVPLLGHGADPDDFPGTKTLFTGSLPDSPDATDDVGVSLVDRGISGKEVEGVHSHSEIFYPESDAWDNLLAVMLGERPEPAEEQPPPIGGC
ncbi:alpha/beta hydrolase [Glycomyces xiaoerkulensis]|uniref:alpha/beta hydrolase n=1 Tax=Glycomyces xiaoerkulensis TaxID=2038139 RepID=UPI000C2601BA|nr:alpha/beta hydrolase [Glycomyces xiaoerkulensis]